MVSLRAIVRVLSMCALLVTQVILSPPASAASGDLDPSFGIGGKVTTNVAGGEIWDIAVQLDGKIVAAGDIGGHFGLARYNADGSLDPTFGVAGLVTTVFGPCCDVAQADAIQSDGKIVAAGFASSGQDFALARYNADGSLDTSFDGDGMVTTDFGGLDVAHGVAIQPDGKIVAAGFVFDGSLDFALARYNPDGGLDSTFDGDGKARTSFGFGASISDVSVQADGKIIAAGSNGCLGFALSRYNPDGSLDSTFDGDGKVTTSFGPDSACAFAEGIVIDNSGKIVAAGENQTAAGEDFALARYDSNGNLDTSFDTDGLVTTDFGSGFEGANDVAVQTNGKVVAAGFSGSQFFGDFALVRYESNGTLDTSFGTGGEVTTDFGSDSDGANSVAIQTDGRIVAAGRSVSGVSLAFALARYQDGAITAVIDIKPGSSTNPIKLQSSGTIPVAILSTSTFDATTVDPASVCFGDAQSPAERDCTALNGSIQDVNGDGRTDLMLHFKTRQTGIDPGDTQACLTGMTSSGVSIEGCDSIKTH